MPRRHIQVQSTGLQVIPVAIVSRILKQILEAPRPAAQIGEGQPDVALAVVGGVIHGDEQALAAGILPGVGDELVG